MAVDTYMCCIIVECVLKVLYNYFYDITTFMMGAGTAEVTHMRLIDHLSLR